MWLPQEIIRQKRDGHAIDAQDIKRFVAGICDQSLSEGQIAAFAMAVFFQGMSLTERSALTLAMRDSGQVLTWWVNGPVVDKHSTGGVGDLVSLVWGPLMAACGCYVPMISGRGLGHTGGTLDKLDSIPGYCSVPDLARFQQVVQQVGVAIVGQTATLAPADGRLYSIRDVTATVESLDLITASILAKKLAAGLDGLIMDVKTGSGAFMPEIAQAEALARSIVDVATHAGVATQALLTDMNQPLADSAGNAIEVRESIAILKGETCNKRLLQVIKALAEQALLAVGVCHDSNSAAQKVQQALASGAAAERFAAMVHALGGPADIVERATYYLPVSRYRREVCSPHSGFVSGIDTREVGLAVVALGGGRRRPEDAIDPHVGLAALAHVGDHIDARQPLAVIHANDAAQADEAEARLLKAYRLSAHAVESDPCIVEQITKDKS